VETKAEVKPRATALTAELERHLDRAQQTAAVESAHHRDLEAWLRGLAARTFVQPAPSVANPTPHVVQPSGLHVQATGETLSAREVDVLRLIASGANNAEIAQHFVISVNTVKTHVARILAKLQVASRTAAAVRARELGLT
jgi:DNA-binding NarL/FixJ family response regulator